MHHLAIWNKLILKVHVGKCKWKEMIIYALSFKKYNNACLLLILAVNKVMTNWPWCTTTPANEFYSLHFYDV